MYNLHRLLMVTWSGAVAVFIAGPRVTIRHKAVVYLNGELVGILSLKVQLAIDAQHARVLADAEVRRLVARHDGVPEQCHPLVHTVI